MCIILVNSVEIMSGVYLPQVDSHMIVYGIHQSHIGCQ